MAQPYIGWIQTFACNFAPVDYAQCNGQLVAIAQNSALFSILGTSFGGNGQTNFALPNLQGRAPMHWGSPPGLSPTDLGEAQGSSTVTLQTPQMPMHNHMAFAAAPGQGQTSERTPSPTTDGQSYLSNSAPALVYYQGNASLNAPMNPFAVAGGSQPHENMQPYLVLNMCIALYGAFPPRG